MADYYPLIAKAVSGLDKSTGEARRALYDRARTALLAQLRGVEPALSEPDITRERLALEEAIRKVEAEAARRSRGEPLAAAARPESRQEIDPSAEGTADPPEELPNPLPRYDLRASRPTIAPADDGDGRSDVEETPQAVPLSAAAAKPVVEARQAEEPRIRTPRAPAGGGEGGGERWGPRRRVRGWGRWPGREPQHSLLGGWSGPRWSRRIGALVVVGVRVLSPPVAAPRWPQDLVASIPGASSPARTA